MTASTLAFRAESAAPGAVGVDLDRLVASRALITGNSGAGMLDELLDEDTPKPVPIDARLVWAGRVTRIREAKLALAAGGHWSH